MNESITIYLSICLSVCLSINQCNKQYLLHPIINPVNQFISLSDKPSAKHPISQWIIQSISQHHIQYCSKVMQMNLDKLWQNSMNFGKIKWCFKRNKMPANHEWKFKSSFIWIALIFPTTQWKFTWNICNTLQAASNSHFQKHTLTFWLAVLTQDSTKLSLSAAFMFIVGIATKEAAIKHAVLSHILCFVGSIKYFVSLFIFSFLWIFYYLFWPKFS